ncbi:hypothetical protein HK100_000304 [Physocladia obscura]|uniref:Uncharacterized protein n=1 Tax=Physocladia obscura TaxID=109957 RepID=A0AAD5XFA7_9FUNG|nr:hypothetical protein HK100_000304 [Physocladia obscura]
MSTSVDYVTVSQANSGEVTTTLYIREYVVVELGATTTTTVTFTNESSDLVLCSAEANLSQFVTCPSALSTDSCVSAACNFSAPNSAESIVVKASVVICSDLDPLCLLGYSIKAKSASVTLSVAPISIALAATTTTTAFEQQSTVSSADSSPKSSLMTMNHDQQSFTATGTSITRQISISTPISAVPASLPNITATATPSSSSNSASLSSSAIAAIVVVFLVLTGLIYYLWATRKIPQRGLHRFPSLYSKNFVQLEDAPVGGAVSIPSAPAPSLYSNQSKNTGQSKKTNSSQFSYVARQSLLDFQTKYDAEPMPQILFPGNMKQLGTSMQIMPSPTSPTSSASPVSPVAIYVDVFGRKIQPAKQNEQNFTPG